MSFIRLAVLLLIVQASTPLEAACRRADPGPPETPPRAAVFDSCPDGAFLRRQAWSRFDPVAFYDVDVAVRVVTFWAPADSGEPVSVHGSPSGELTGAISRRPLPERLRDGPSTASPRITKSANAGSELHAALIALIFGALGLLVVARRGLGDVR